MTRLLLLAAGAMIMSLSLSQPLAAQPQQAAVAPTQDAAAIRTVVESVAVLADRGEFELLEQLYAPEVRLDYTSLAGGQPEVVSNSELMTRWAGLLPGFDRTGHQLSNIRAEVRGERATASADVVADHWLGGEAWQVRGRYEYALVRDGRDWRITDHRFTLTGEEGSRALLARATEAAKARPASFTTRAQARRTVLDFLEGLEQKDIARVNGVWAEDAVQEMPYAPQGFAQRVAGRDNLIRHYAGWPQASGRAEFTDGIVFYPTKDPEIVAVEYRGSVDGVPTGRHYAQRYFGLFHVEGGKIRLFREYFDPNAFADAFALNEGGRFNASQEVRP